MGRVLVGGWHRALANSGINVVTLSQGVWLELGALVIANIFKGQERRLPCRNCQGVLRAFYRPELCTR